MAEFEVINHLGEKLAETDHWNTARGAAHAASFHPDKFKVINTRTGEEVTEPPRCLEARHEGDQVPQRGE